MTRSRLLLLFTLLTSLLACKKPSESNHEPLETNQQETPKKDSVIIPKKTSAHPIEREPEFQLPHGFILYEKISGDLNGDSINDYVVIIKGTDKSKVIQDEYQGELDRNRRGLLIYLSSNNDFTLATKNLDCFSSENEDGGVYYPPQLSISIKNGKFYVAYEHGRYGYWKYTFRYQQNRFKLIGYDASENYGPIVNKVTSINYLTKRKLIRDNINKDLDEYQEEIFKDTWERIEVKSLHQLSEIKDFDNFL